MTHTPESNAKRSTSLKSRWSRPDIRQQFEHQCKCGFKTNWPPARANHEKANPTHTHT